MPLSAFELDAILLAQLTERERARGVEYAAADTVAAGTTLRFPQCEIEVDRDSALAFVDREPLANWGHSCRYLLAQLDDGAVRSVDARFPPFPSGGRLRWRVLYRAPGLPDAVLAAFHA